jgi:Mannose-6-phosphate isomerase
MIIDELLSNLQRDRADRWSSSVAVHRLENPGKILLELIEVQTGSYFREDNIIRIEDDYQRL